jgi:bacteriorhodopsin
MTDTVAIFQTIAFSTLFVTSVIIAFQGLLLLSLIPGIAATAYYFMLEDPDNKQRYRYLDWAITTPLMLIAIFLANNVPIPFIIGLVLLDLLMIGAGYLGTQEPDKIKKLLLFGGGCLALLPILYFLFQQKKYTTAIYLTVALWSLYPIVWVLEETETLSETVTISTFSVLDIVSKIGLLYLLSPK